MVHYIMVHNLYRSGSIGTINYIQFNSICLLGNKSNNNFPQNTQEMFESYIIDISKNNHNR